MCVPSNLELAKAPYLNLGSCTFHLRTNMTSAVALLVFLWTIRIAASSPCTGAEKRLVRAHPLNHKSFCINQASRLRPKSMLVLSNASCLLLGACPASSNSSVLYSLVHPGASVPLLRTSTSSQLLAIDLLQTGPENPFDLDAFERNSHDYKNPLVDVHPNPFSRVHLTLWKDGNIFVNITFKTTNKTLRTVDWFAKDAVVGSWPWSLSEVTASSIHFKTKQNFSSIYGDYRSQFYIGTLFEIVADTKFPTEVTFLTGTAHNINHNQYLYVWKPGLSSTNFNQVAELRLYGTLKNPEENFRFYQRMP